MMDLVRGLKAVLRTARENWVNRDDDDSIINQPVNFNKWFSRNAVVTPVIAAFVISSGFVASPQRFLALLDPTGGLIVSQKEYDKGVLYIEQLKNIAGDYLKEYSDNYQLDFSSSDPIVQSRLDKVFS